MPGFQEFIFIIIVIIVLNATGLWPVVMKALREWRGGGPEEAHMPPPGSADADLCYRLLGLSPSASWEEIEKAYRRKAKVHHPDHGGDGDTMRALNEAYQTLKRMRKMR